MSQPRPLKKSESLEIRIPHATKTAFMDRCRQDGCSASESLRAYIEAQIEPAPRPVRRGGGWALAAGIVAACGLTATALPSLARPSAQAAFARLDTNSDQRVSLAEFERRASVTITYGQATGLPVTTEPELQEALLRAQFSKLDRNGDGFISLAEFAGRP